MICAVFLSQFILYIQMQATPEFLLPSSLIGYEGQPYALITLALCLTGLLISLVGIVSVLRNYSRKFIRKFNSDYNSRINKSSLFGNVFYISSLSYLVFILFSSNTVIYRAESFSLLYGIQVPSSYLISCCGIPGSYPVISVYLTENLGLMITPTSLFLCGFLPLLIGLYAQLIALNKSSLRNSHNTRLGILGIFGSCAGVIGACPSCAGTVLNSITILLGTTIIFNIFYHPLFQVVMLPATIFSLIYSIKSFSSQSTKSHYSAQITRIDKQ